MMKRRAVLFALTVLAALSAAGFPPAHAQDKTLTVFAAASMKNALDDIDAAFTKKTDPTNWRIDSIWKPGDSVNLAIGQGNLEATPLQAAVAYAAIANGGYLVTPHLGVRIVDSQGKLVRRLPYTQPRRIGISPQTIGVVQNALHEAATTPAGTSYPVFGNYRIPVAGKTGTAQVFGQDDYAWYCSYAPANDPQYVVVVMIQQGGHGGVSAAPAARMIYDSLFHVAGGQSTGTVHSD